MSLSNRVAPPQLPTVLMRTARHCADAVYRSARGPAAVWLLLLMVISVTATAARAQDDYERMEQFLTRLGLSDLRIAHLEETLNASISQQRKRQLARRLADLYAARLMAAADDTARYDDTVGRINSLLARFPDANTTALQVMLLQADYNRAESLIAAWIGEPTDTASRDEARQILARITPQLVTYQNELNQKVESLLSEIDELPDGDLLDTKESELRGVQGIAARATYFAAWSNYYTGLVTGAAPQAPPFVKAREIFLHLLGFDDELPDDLEPEWLGLESIWRSRAVIGLGLSVAACGDIDAAQRCFEVLEHPSAPTEIRDQAPYWYVRALLRAGQLDRAETFARQKITYYQPPPTQGKVSLCVALVREGFGVPGNTAVAQRRKLGNLGLVGLARLGQLGAINTLIDKYQIKPDSDSGFVLLWAAGQQQFAQAEKAKSETGYREAAATLEKALRSPETKTLAGPAARCRYTLGWCYFRLEQLEQAAQEFSNAFPGLRESNDELAVEAAWMAFAAYRQLAESQPQFANRASDAEKRLQQNFAEHPYTQRASYEMTKLLEKTDPATMINQLEAIGPDDDSYALARYDLCMLLHRLWQRDRDDEQKSAERLASLAAAAKTYLTTVQGDPDAQRPLRVCLLAADAALHDSRPQLDVADDMLTRAKPFAAQLADSNGQVAEYHYRLLELAAAQENAQQRRQQAQWIADNAAGSPYELSALLIVANAIDREIRGGASGGTDALNRQAYDVYRRLVDVLGTSPQQLAGSRNAQVAASRLAHYAMQTGQVAEAAATLDELLKVKPRDRRYLQRAAAAHAAANQYAAALPHLRTLLSGLPSGSDEWLQAKYDQLVALGRTDKEQARKVYRQFELLHPQLGGADWRSKFTELARTW